MLYDIFTHVSTSFLKCPQEKPGGAVAGKKTILQRTLIKTNSWLGSKNNFFAADADTSKITGLGKKDVQRPMIRTGIFLGNMFLFYANK